MDSSTGPEKHARLRLDSMDEISSGCSPEVSDMYKLSPFVWKNGARLDLLLRVVNRDEDASRKVARVHHGTSTDGVHFTLEATPVIAPDSDPQCVR